MISRVPRSINYTYRKFSKGILLYVRKVTRVIFPKITLDALLKELCIGLTPFAICYYLQLFWPLNVWIPIFITRNQAQSLVLEFEIWRHFDTKQKSKSFTFCHCIWLCLIVWFTLILKEYQKLNIKNLGKGKPYNRKWPHFFWGLRLFFFGLKTFPFLSLNFCKSRMSW